MIKNDEIRRILVVRTDRVGDVVLTTPAMKALRDHFPGVHIAGLVSPVTAPLLRGNPCIDEVIVDDRKREHKGLRGFFRLLRRLRRGRFDLAVVFHTKRRTNALCFLAGIKHRLGYRNNKYGFLLNHPVNDDRAQGTRHEIQYCLELLRPLGVEGGSLQTFVPLEPEAVEWVHQLFFRETLLAPVAAVHTGASDPSKQWPAECFAEVIRHLAEKRRCRIVMIGTADQETLVSRIREWVDVPVLDLTGRTSIAQLAALLKHCALLVSNDSGPVHLAHAVQTPVVSIFTRNQPGINPERWGPLGARSRWVAPPPGRLFFPEGRISAEEERKRVDPQQVIDAVDALFKLC